MWLHGWGHDWARFHSLDPGSRADHLLFFHLDFENLRGEVVFNGPESIALQKLPSFWNNQRSLTLGQIRSADKLVASDQRLAMVAASER